VVEAAAAFAKEMRVSRHVLHMSLDPSSGPEAAAMLAAEEPRAARKAAAPTEAAEEDSEIRPNQRKRAAEPDAGEVERRRKIERLTDLCDRLLERGVLVYSSTRELLAIEVRERKGELPGKEEEQQKGAEEAEATAGVAAAAGEAATESAEKASNSAPAADSGAVAAAAMGGAAATLIYENKRYQAPAGQSAVTEAAAEVGGAQEVDSNPLLWQYRWAANPDQGSYGPFDSVTMQGWVTQGCFEQNPVEIRQCDAANQPQERCWHKGEEIDFELYL